MTSIFSQKPCQYLGQLRKGTHTMQIQEVSEKTGLTKRAIKFYEEKGFLRVEKAFNGYRNYTEQHVELLKEISFYRKLGVSLKDIRLLLEEKDPELLYQIYRQKKQALEASEKELKALELFLQTHDIDAACEQVDYARIGQAMQEQLPGFFGYYFLHHFEPYLQISITTEEQQKAYATILDFWDNTKIRIPLFLRLSGWLTWRFSPKADMEQTVTQIDNQLQKLLHPSEAEYQMLLAATRRSIQKQNRLFSHFSPYALSARRLRKQLQDCGYHDIFLPAMQALSPKYREYHQALTALNQRICQELGIYYDSEFRIVWKG